MEPGERRIRRKAYDVIEMRIDRRASKGTAMAPERPRVIPTDRDAFAIIHVRTTDLITPRITTANAFHNAVQQPPTPALIRVVRALCFVMTSFRSRAEGPRRELPSRRDCYPRRYISALLVTA